MRRQNRKRLQELTRRVEALPIAPEVEDAAFERFCRTGELPESQRLAAVVCKRALRGEKLKQETDPIDFDAFLQQAHQLAKNLEDLGPDTEPEFHTVPLREILFQEAVYGEEVVRLAARGALKLLVAAGRDVTDLEFIDGHMERPEFGSVGLHVLGFPEAVLKPPYEDQGQRLLNRFARLRERIDYDDKQWFEDFEIAANRFLRNGELPQDKLMRDAVLANGEWLWFLAHYVGQGDAEVLAAFDQAAHGSNSRRKAAIGQLEAMAAEGRVLTGDAVGA